MAKRVSDKRSSSSRSQIRSRQEPHPVPALVASPTLSSQRAPHWIAERTSLSRTLAQMHTYNEGTLSPEERLSSVRVP